MKLDVAVEALPLVAPFRISGYTFAESPVLVVRLSEAEAIGVGEASGVYYLDDRPADMAARVESLREIIEAGITRDELSRLLPPGGARNALDCALWDLEARRANTTVWQLAGLPPPRPLLTTFTLGAEAPGEMAAGALRYAQAAALKLKLTGELDEDAERVRAVRQARPDAWIGVDANQGYEPATLSALIPVLVDAGVALLEQPLRRGREADLQGFGSPIPIAADESVQGLDEVEALAGRFDVVNIKLDKCGGLTEGLAMAAAARRLGMQVMVGNMIGSSWAMAPAYLVGQSCDVVDLDGPLVLARDRVPGVVYEQGKVACGDDVWGSPRAPA